MGVVTILGGIGLFLLGMSLMTEALRELAGDAFRRVLARFTRRPWMGALTGTLATAALQSSSAVTVATVGLVAAGVLEFSHAVGIVFGANLGTTITGWLVALLGLKLNLGSVAMAVLVGGALARLFGRRTIALSGQAVAGFCLIFVGIDALQQGMANIGDLLTPSRLPADDMGGRLLLVAIGIGATIVTQSSSAGVATVLVALHAGSMTLAQGAALVIGMDVGTTITAVLASLGRSADTRRTAVAHVGYNLIAAAVALALLDPYLAAWGDGVAAREPEIALVAFHTAFNVVALMLILPLAPRFAALVQRLVPSGESLTRRLDKRHNRDPGIAIWAVRATLQDLAVHAFAVLGRALHRTDASEDVDDDVQAITAALLETRTFLEGVPASARRPRDVWRRKAVLHVLDHLDRLVHRCAKTDRIVTLRRDPALRRAGTLLAHRIALHDATLPSEPDLRRTWEALAAATERDRVRELDRAAGARVDTAELMARLDATRWLRRVAYHAWRIVHHLERSDPATRIEREAVPPHAEAEAPDKAAHDHDDPPSER